VNRAGKTSRRNKGQFWKLAGSRLLESPYTVTGTIIVELLGFVARILQLLLKLYEAIAEARMQKATIETELDRNHY
jgi:hypothetical protein